MITIAVADFTECVENTDIFGKCLHIVDGNNIHAPIGRTVVNDETIALHKAQVLQMTVEDILECINDGRSDEWIDYDETDFIEGMYEWTSLFLTDTAIYNLVGMIKGTYMWPIGLPRKEMI